MRRLSLRIGCPLWRCPLRCQRSQRQRPLVLLLRVLAFAILACGTQTRLFADLTADDLAPRNYTECQLESIAECLSEFHTGRFDGAQNHRSIPVASATAALLRPPHLRLLLLITTIWRNFQRRRLLRNALARCSLLYENPQQAAWRFLLGDVPPALFERAAKEASEHEDMLLLGGDDEIYYRHVGDAYELTNANPELVKIVLALRLLRDALTFDYLMVVDDDSFVSLPNALELLNMVPDERVYIGNMIDSVPQRWDAKRKRIAPEYTVNLYLGAPSKVPIFAHGMGFIISQDVARFVGDMGLSLKARGNDDMLFGVWLRSLEHLHYLHYWPWFVDHEEFAGAFTQPCDSNAVVVHRMTVERWRRFTVHDCSVCAQPQDPLSVEPDPPIVLPSASVASASGSLGGRKSLRCIEASQLACSWKSEAREGSRKGGVSSCVGRCRNEAWIGNSTRAGCPLSICHAFCQSPGPYSSLCPEPTSSSSPSPQLAVCIFGSAWADMHLRRLLRAALRSCAAEHLGVRAAPHVFVMGPLPKPGNPLRRDAVREMLQKRDLAVARPGASGFDTGFGGSSIVVNATYAYVDAWRIVEERFGGADFLLMLDHRSFANVPAIVHMVLPRLPREKLYLGCLIDETFYGNCLGMGNSRCDYLWRRRTPLFAHGMGFVISADVARFVSDMGSKMSLRKHDIPVDAAFGMWIQLLEGLSYESVHGLFHEWAGGGVDSKVSQPLSASSSIVFPMTAERWRYFDAFTCTLSEHGRVSKQWQAGMLSNIDSVDSVSQASRGTKTAAAMPAEQASNNVALAGKVEDDCWRGMGGRPQAWYLVCCELHWDGCWGGDFTETRCCGRLPVEGASVMASGDVTPLPNAADRLEALRRFLEFDNLEVRLFVDWLSATSVGAKDSHEQNQFKCLTPVDCAREGFARFYRKLWATGALPMRHPWITNTSDHLFGLALKLRSENDGWGPKGHEHTLERVQLAYWLKVCADHMVPEAVPGERRCLEWDSAQYSRHFFFRHCKILDVLTYSGEGVARMESGANGQRRYLVDIHDAEAVIPADSVGIVVCAQIFEHLRRPHLAMQQLFRFVAPGGFVVWSAPMFSEVHGAPEDFFRYTPLGARALAEDSGFVVVGQYAPGGLRELAGYLVGMTAPYWQRDDLLYDSGSSWPLQVYMLLQKPSAE